MDRRMKAGAPLKEPRDIAATGLPPDEDRRSARIGRLGARSPAPEEVRLRARELADARGEERVTLDDWLDAECELLVWESTLSFS